MKPFFPVLLGAVVVSAPAFASPDLAARHECMNCHQERAKVVGPAFKDVAARYSDDKNAEAKLAEKILKGGAGVWGPIPMPANSKVSGADAKTLAKWVLSIR